jgi:hypothetical protein
MRLFRRRPFSSSDSQAEQQSRLINVRAVNTDHNHQQHIPATESERDTLDDCNYQTVQAVPAVVVAESPKSSRKKGVRPTIFVHFGLLGYIVHEPCYF